MRKGGWCLEISLLGQMMIKSMKSYQKLGALRKASPEDIMAYFLGIDSSTTATKALLIDENGLVIATGSSEYPFETPKPLWSEQHPGLWWRGAVETAMVLLDDPEVARRFPAGVCRCRRAANYVRRILRRYAAYVEQFPPA